MKMFLGWMLLVAALAVGCDVARDLVVTGSGNIVTEAGEFTDFTSVEAGSAFNMEIVQAASFSVTVRADDNLMERVRVSRDGDALKFHLDRGVSFRNATLEADITMPDLNGLRLSGASRGTVSGFRLTHDIDLELSGASSLEGDLEVSEARIECSGASIVTLRGSADDLRLNASGASILNLEDFAVTTARVELSGASNATVNVTDEISSANISGASRLTYVGDPTLSNVSTSGASSITKR